MRHHAAVDDGHAHRRRAGRDVPGRRQVDAARRLEQTPLLAVLNVVGHHQRVHHGVGLDRGDALAAGQPPRHLAGFEPHHPASEPHHVRAAGYLAQVLEPFAEHTADGGQPRAVVGAVLLEAKDEAVAELGLLVDQRAQQGAGIGTGLRDQRDECPVCRQGQSGQRGNRGSGGTRKTARAIVACRQKEGGSEIEGERWERHRRVTMRSRRRVERHAARHMRQDVDFGLAARGYGNDT